MTYFLPFVFALVISFVMTNLVRKFGFKHGILSKPRARDIHKRAVPRIGGIAIFSSFLIVSLVSYLFFCRSLGFGSEQLFGIDLRLLGIWIGSTLITVSMLVDDIYGLKAWQKLLVQLLATVVMISCGLGIDTLSNPFGNTINLNSVYIPLITIKGMTYHFSLWSDLLTLIWMVGMMNVLNFIDGIDGLAAGNSVIAALTIFLLSLSAQVNQPQVALLSVILAGSAMGFLIWNFPPAKIFMGDSGSMFLGFMLGLLPLLSGGKLATAFLVLGFPIIDGLVVAGGRVFRGKNPFTTPDKTHLHHRFIAAGFSVRQALLSMYLIAILFAWVALRSTTLNKLVAAVELVVLLVVIILLLNRKARRAKKELAA